MESLRKSRSVVHAELRCLDEEIMLSSCSSATDPDDLSSKHSAPKLKNNITFLKSEQMKT